MLLQYLYFNLIYKKNYDVFSHLGGILILCVNCIVVQTLIYVKFNNISA